MASDGEVATVDRVGCCFFALVLLASANALVGPTTQASAGSIVWRSMDRLLDETEDTFLSEDNVDEVSSCCQSSHAPVANKSDDLINAFCRL
jgi:hypothetical protein